VDADVDREHGPYEPLLETSHDPPVRRGGLGSRADPSCGRRFL